MKGQGQVCRVVLLLAEREQLEIWVLQRTAKRVGQQVCRRKGARNPDQ